MTTRRPRCGSRAIINSYEISSRIVLGHILKAFLVLISCLRAPRPCSIVCNIVRCITPFQVRCCIICRITVLVIHNIVTERVGYENICDNPMHPDSFLCAAIAKRYNMIAILVNNRRKDSTLANGIFATLCPNQHVKRPNSSKITHLIPALIPRNILPNFLLHTLKKAPELSVNGSSIRLLIRAFIFPLAISTIAIQRYRIILSPANSVP